MTTIQDRIIKDFREQFNGNLWSDADSLAISMDNKVEQFLIQSIKEVEEETRKETLDKVEKNLSYAECIQPHEEPSDAQWFFHIDKSTWLELKEKLSITNKDK